MTGRAAVESFPGTLADRVARGKAARKASPRTAHAGFTASADRRDPIAVLEEQAATRVPELVPIRYGRMVSSPFAFFRGAAAIMAMDLATAPSTGLKAQLCGDAHLVNFGVYNSPERRLVFDLNDFDETLPGPWEWDLKRLVASMVVAGRDNGYEQVATQEVARDTVRAYRTAMASFAAMSNQQVWYARLEVDEVLTELRARMTAQRAKLMQRNIGKFASRDNLQAFSRLTVIGDGPPHFASEPPLVVPIDQLAGSKGADWVRREAHRILGEYRATLDDDRRHLVAQYEYADLARKVVGVGSVGTRAWITLLFGRDEKDPLILQFKEAQPSVLEPYLGASAYAQPGHRVVSGQRLMQAASDIFLGWYRGRGLDGDEHSFYVRQLRDGKGSVDIANLDPAGMRIYGGLCAWTLARGHARSGDRVAIAAYLGTSRTFDDSLVAFAHDYADQNERDHAALRAAIDSGRIVAQEGI
jgi:uncharacterized protein (DUF2252 family)